MTDPVVPDIADAMLHVDYPGGGERPHTEVLPARWLDDNRFELASHSLFIPLGPGDVVTATYGLVTGVARHAEDWVIEVFIDHRFSDDYAAELFVRWQRDVRLTETSPLTCRISSSTREWVDRNVVSCGGLDFIDVLRQPMQIIDFDAAVAAS
jgi:hypothetical protein